MKRIIFVTVFFFIFTSFLPLNAQWARTYGGSGIELAYSIQQTSDGGYIVAGSTHPFGAGDHDIWILKLSSTGTIDWQYKYGGSDDDRAYSIQQTRDGGYIVAGKIYQYDSGTSDIWILKLSSTGTIDWQHTYGGSDYDWASSIQQTSDGGYIVAGFTDSFGAGGHDIWVLKLSSTGTIDWQHTYGGSGTEDAFSIKQTSDGGYIVAGRTSSSGAGGLDIWVLKLSSTGAIDWQHTYGGSEHDWADSIHQTSDGGYIIAGSIYQYGYRISDIWVLKLSSTGAIDWQHTYGGSNEDWPSSIQQTSDGGYIVAGFTDSFGAGGYDILVLKLSSTGTIDWQHTYGGMLTYEGEGHDEAYSIQQTSDGGYIVAGFTDSFGAGRYDILVLKLFSDGDIDSSCGFIGSSDALGAYTSVFDEYTSITPQSISITPSHTNVFAQDTNATVFLICATEYTLSISTTTGGTTDPAPGTDTYDSGAQASVQALPSSGYQFISWSGDVSETTNPITITMDSNKSITANFALVRQRISGDGNGDGGGGGGGLCLIATAAYGSSLHPHVDVLRDFRNKYLIPHRLGRELVDLYYKYSPFMANIIAKHKGLRVIVQINLTPIVVFSYSMIHLGPIVTGGILLLIFVLPIFFMSALLRKRG